MDSEMFREFGKKMIDFIADYIENIRDRQVLPSVRPGYLLDIIPKEAPDNADDWNQIFNDIETIIMPGITHWHSPYFHAYFPTASSYPAILGDLLSTGIGCVGFNWITSPACTELEVQMMNWIGKLFNLPEEFLNSSKSSGGGVIQGSASEATLFTLIVAKENVIKLNVSDTNIKHKLVAYTSAQSNSSVEKAGILGSVIMRLLPTDSNNSLRGHVLEKAIFEDKKLGLVPFYVVATLGTTNSCSFDNLLELGNVCQKEKIWLHVDAAFAGAALICPEYQYFIKGIELATSFNVNLHKWMLVNFDCSALWMKNSLHYLDVFKVDPIYLKDDHNSVIIPNYRHWQIPLGRRFRSLKVWMVLRSYGVQGIRKHIRSQIRLAKDFENLVLDDNRFQIVSKTQLSLVCFRLKGDNSLTQQLIDNIFENKQIYVISGKIKDLLMIRFVICSRICTLEDVRRSWSEIQYQADRIIVRNIDSLEFQRACK